MDTRKVNYKVRYLGKSSFDIKQNKIYDCVLEWYNDKKNLFSLSVIDESGEDYCYDSDNFEKLDA